MPADPLTSLKVTPEARDALRKIALTVSAVVGRRVSMSDALLAAADVADHHPDEVISKLTKEVPS